MKIYFMIAVILLFAITVAAQTSKKSVGKRNAKKVAVAEMSDLARINGLFFETRKSYGVVS